MLRKNKVDNILNKLIYIPLVIGCCLVLTAFFKQQLFLTTSLIFILIAICGAINPNTSALSLANQGKYTGSASALFGTIQFITATIFSFLINFFHDGTAKPICIIIGSCGILCFVIKKIFWEKFIKKRAKNNLNQTIDLVN